MGLFQSIKHLLPTGEPFRLGDKFITKMWEGLGSFGDSVKEYIDLVYLDLFPETTRELEEWERFYGLNPSSDSSEISRRQALAAEWASTGGQSPAYIQGVLHAAGFDVWIHEWWESSGPWVARDPHDHTTPPIVGTFQCYDNYDPGGPSVEPWLTAGDADAQADAWLANDPGYWANLTLDPLAPPPIPENPALYPYFLYFSGENFPEHALILASRKQELQRLVQKLKPAQNWVVLICDVVTSIEELLNQDDEPLLTQKDEIIYA